MKRKSNCNERLEVSKRPKPEEDRLSKLSPKVLKNVAVMLKAGNDDIKALSQAGKVFNEICLPRLALRVNFDKIFTNGAYPVLTRAYETIAITGMDVDENELNLQEALKSSRDSARKLHIGAEQDKGVMSQRALVAILNALPNIEELIIQGMAVQKPLTRFSAIKFWDFPILSSLKSLKVINCSGEVLSAFQRFEKLTQMHIEMNSKDVGCVELSKIVSKQLELKALYTNSQDALFGLEIAGLPSLTSFVGPEIMFGVPEGHIFKIAPKLANISIISAFGDFLGDSLFMTNTSEHLKAIKTKAMVADNFDFTRVRENFSSLEVFMSKNLTWRKSCPN